MAEALERTLGVPLVAKDAIKETLFEFVGTGDRDWSRRLGRATLELMFSLAARQLAAGLPLILEANFSRRFHTARFGDLPSHHLVQIHLTAPASVLLEREDTRTRHPGHLQGVIRGEIEAVIESGDHGALDLDGELIELDSSRPFDVAAVAARVAAGRGRASRSAEAGSPSAATSRQ